MNLLIAVDLDGCMVDGRKRYAAAGSEPEGNKDSIEWQKWLSVVMNPEEMAKDLPVKPVVEAVRRLSVTQHVVFITSRGEQHREGTLHWLRCYYDCGDITLIMRPEGRLDADHDLKEVAIAALVQELKPSGVLVLDDDIKGGLAKVCAKHGWTLLKVQGHSQEVK